MEWKCRISLINGIDDNFDGPTIWVLNEEVSISISGYTNLIWLMKFYKVLQVWFLDFTAGAVAGKLHKLHYWCYGSDVSYKFSILQVRPIKKTQLFFHTLHKEILQSWNIWCSERGSRGARRSFELEVGQSYYEHKI